MSAARATVSELSAERMVTSTGPDAYSTVSASSASPWLSSPSNTTNARSGSSRAMTSTASATETANGVTSCPRRSSTPASARRSSSRSLARRIRMARSGLVIGPTWFYTLRPRPGPRRRHPWRPSTPAHHSGDWCLGFGARRRPIPGAGAPSILAGSGEPGGTCSGRSPPARARRRRRPGGPRGPRPPLPAAGPPARAALPARRRAARRSQPGRLAGAAEGHRPLRPRAPDRVLELRRPHDPGRAQAPLPGQGLVRPRPARPAGAPDPPGTGVRAAGPRARASRDARGDRRPDGIDRRAGAGGPRGRRRLPGGLPGPAARGRRGRRRRHRAGDRGPGLRRGRGLRHGAAPDARAQRPRARGAAAALRAGPDPGGDRRAHRRLADARVAHHPPGDLPPPGGRRGVTRAGTLPRMEHWDLRTLDVEPHQPKILHSARGEARSILISLPAGEALEEHQVHERAYVVVVDGRVELAGHAGGAGLAAVFDPGERHAVRAVEDSRLLIVLAPWPGDGHPGARD